MGVLTTVHDVPGDVRALSTSVLSGSVVSAVPPVELPAAAADADARR